MMEDRDVTRRTFLRLGGGALAATAGASGCAWLRLGDPAGPFDVPYEHLASDIGALQSSYDVVVIGSGYGGSIAAARLAPGRSVALLERGVEWAPGSYPETVDAVLDARRGRGNPLGLFDWRQHGEIDVISGSGLGGTSLINANLIVDVDPRIFALARWPHAIRRDRDSGRLEEYAATARTMLGGSMLPSERMAGATALATGIVAAGGRFEPPRVAVNLGTTPNPVGVAQIPCTFCGACVSGCNVSAKNTLNLNYLPLAHRNGARLFTQIEVANIVKLPSGRYEIHASHAERLPVINSGPPSPRSGQPDVRPRVVRRPVIIQARSVIVAAGSVGSTEILLRSRARGLRLSDTLGKGFTGNADVLGFAYNGAQRTDIVGFGTRSRRYADVGPTINGVGIFPGRDAPLEERFLIESAVIPRAIAPLIARAAPLISGDRPEERAEGEMGRALSDLRFRFDPNGALNHSLVLLGMGYDSGTGVVTLDERTGNARVDWKGVQAEPIFARIETAMRSISHAIGATYIRNPRSTWIGGEGLTTVHPLGGCCMGRDSASGVVDHGARVFDPSQDAAAVHEGLYVIDGAIVPTSVGVNPLLTISTLAERAVAEINAGALS
jgi:cholesterol oxidase